MKARRIEFLLVFLLAVAVAAWRYMPYVSTVYYGDDLHFYLSMHDGRFGARITDVFFHAYQERFRPVGFGYAVLLFKIFGSYPLPSIAVNLLLVGISSVILFAIVNFLTDGNRLLAVSMAFAVAGFRFVVVPITQIIQAEVLAFTLFIGLIYCVIRTHSNSSYGYRWGWLAIVIAFLLIHTHERYIVIFLWLAVFFLFSAPVRHFPHAHRKALVAASLFAPLLNVLYKLTVLHSPFFVGTAGTHMTLNIAMQAKHFLHALMSIFGFNNGPAYLVGIGIMELPWWSPAWIFAIILIVSWLILAVAWVMQACGMMRSIGGENYIGRREIFLPLMFLILAGLLLIPAVAAATELVALRWLMGPFVCLIFLFPVSVAMHVKKIYRLPACIFLFSIVFSNIVLDGIFARHFGNVFTSQAARLVNEIKSAIIDVDSMRGQPLLLINVGSEQCKWSLANGRIFEVYENRYRMVMCARNNETAFKLEVDNEARVFLLTRRPDWMLKEVSRDWHALKRTRSATTLHDFLSDFESGKINNDMAMDTPSGKGVALLPVDTKWGRFSAITIVPGFSYQFSPIEITYSDYFMAGVGVFHPGGGHNRAVIEIKSLDQNPVQSTYLIDLPPLRSYAPQQMLPVSIPLNLFYGKTVSITLSTESFAENPSAKWIFYAYPRISKAVAPGEGEPVENFDLEPAYPGEKLDFGSSGKGVHYLQAGWSDPEDWGTWSDSRSATILLPASPAQVDSVVIDFAAAVSSSHPAQRVEIFVNGSQAYSGSISERFGTLKIKIPDAAKSDAFKGITMEFRLPDAARPKDIGLGEDMRTLALALRTITLTEQ